MSVIGSINRLFDIYLAALKALGRPQIWLPFFIYAILQFLTLLLLVYYPEPLIRGILAPVIALLGPGREDFFSHYPGLFIMLPAVFQWGKLILGIILEGLVAGLTVLLFVRVYQSGRTAGADLKFAFSRWVDLLITWSVITIILLLLNWALASAFGGFVQGSPRRVLMLDFGTRFLTVLCYALLVYAVPAVVIKRTSFAGAIKISLRCFGKYPVFTFFMTLISYLLTLPVSYLISQSDSIVAKFTPELVVYILVAGIITDLLANIILSGAAAKFLIEEEI